jgi:ADP-ribose pyrophosphatase
VSEADLPVSDTPAAREVVEQAVRFEGAKWSLVTDVVRLPEDGDVVRDVVVHPGAVGVIAMDDDDHVVLIRQYRHPVVAELWELPAGLLDDDAETPLRAAQRELFEEAHLRATTWHVLIDLYTSPGMSSEVVRVYLARGLVDVPAAERHVQTEEERDMPSRRVRLDQACDLVLSGRLHNAMAAAGLLALERARSQQWAPLRPADAPWLDTKRPSRN